MNANQRKSVEIGPPLAMFPGPLELAFLGRLFLDKTFGNKSLIFIKPHVVGEILDSFYITFICGHLHPFAAEISIKILARSMLPVIRTDDG